MYDEKKRPMTDIPLEDILVKGATISSLIQCTGVWFAGSKFGLSWKAVQIKADHLPESIRGFAFRDEDESNATKPVAAPEPARQPVASSNHFQSLAEDDDEVDDDAVLNAPAPKSSAVVAPPAMEEDDADIIEPIAVPKKTVTTAAKVIKKVTTVKK